MESKDVIDKYFGSKISVFNGELDSAESLQAAVYLLLINLGLSIDRARVARHFSRHSIGNDMARFVKTAYKLGKDFNLIDVDGVRTINEHLLPCIAQSGDEYVLATRVDRGTVHFVHPTEGRQTISILRWDERFNGKIIYPSDDREKNAAAPFTLRELYKGVSGLKRAVLRTFALSIFIQIFAFSLPLFAQLTIDHIVPNQDKYLLLIVGLGFGCIVLIDGLVKILAGFVTTNLLIYLNANTLVSVFNHLVHLPQSFFEDRQMGDILSRFKSIEPLNGRVAKDSIDIIIDSLMVLTMATVMLIYAPVIAAVSFGCFIVITVIRVSFNNVLKHLETKATECYAVSSSYFIETFSSMQSIRVLQGEVIRRNQWLERHLKALGFDEQRIKLALTIDNIAELIGGVEMVVAIAMSALFVIDAQMTLGTMFAYLSYRTLFSTHASRLVKNIFDLRLLSVYLNRINTIMSHEKISYSESAVSSAVMEEMVVQGKPVIQLINISYSYPNSTSVILNDVSLDIYPGELVCLEGDSGAGKTTLIKIMLGLLPPSSGRVLINGVELNYLVRQRGTICSALLQGDRVFDQTIAENVAGMDGQVDFHRVVDICKLVNMHTEICQLREGYDTVLNRNQNNISGGQEQRLLLARALYQNPRILFLDEVTSNLDKTNEIVINNVIAACDSTRIIIDHKKALSNTADKVIHVSNGNIKVEKPATHKDISNRV